MDVAAHYPPIHSGNKWLPALASLLMHALLVLVLYYGVSWQSHPPEAVSAELVQSLPPLPSAQPEQPRIEPPRPEPQAQPKPAPKPEPKLKEPEIEKPDIAIKKVEPKKKEPEKKEKPHEEKKPLEKPKEPAKPEPKPKDTPKSDPKIKEAKPSSSDDSRLQALMNQETKRLNQTNTMAKLDQERARIAGIRAEGDKKALGNARDEWINQIKVKVRGKMTLPPGISGNPKAEFALELLPDGSLAREPRLTKSSGIPALDEAAKRAILKSDPLPLPSKPEVFERSLKFVFDPLGE